jgi:hypothetical protein
MPTRPQYGPPIVDFSALGEIPDAYAKGQDRQREEAFRQVLAGWGGTDYNDLVRRAAQAGNIPGIQLASQLANAQATREHQRASLAATVEHNRAIEGKPQIFGNENTGYQALYPQGREPSGAPLAPPVGGAAPPRDAGYPPNMVGPKEGAALGIYDTPGRQAQAAPQQPPGVRQLTPPVDREFSPEGRDIAARQIINGDMSGLTNLGRGAQGDKRILAVRNRAAEILINERGMAPDEAASHLGTQLQKYKAATIGQNTWARTAAGREANLDIILKATEAAVPAAIEASAAVNRTTFTPVNKIIQKGQLMTSDPNLVKFGMANLQLAEHWARAMNPTGVMRESDRDLALNFLSTANSHPTYVQAVKQLQVQIEREKAAVRGGHTVVATPGSTREIPKDAINDLLSNPGTAAQFDQWFGPGQSGRILGAIGAR